MAMHSRFYTIVALLALMLGHAAAVDVRLSHAIGGVSPASGGPTLHVADDCGGPPHDLASRARYLDRLSEGQQRSSDTALADVWGDAGCPASLADASDVLPDSR